MARVARRRAHVALLWRTLAHRAHSTWAACARAVQVLRLATAAAVGAAAATRPPSERGIGDAFRLCRWTHGSRWWSHLSHQHVRRGQGRAPQRRESELPSSRGKEAWWREALAGTKVAQRGASCAGVHRHAHWHRVGCSPRVARARRGGGPGGSNDLGSHWLCGVAIHAELCAQLHLCVAPPATALAAALAAATSVTHPPAADSAAAASHQLRQQRSLWWLLAFDARRGDLRHRVRRGAPPPAARPLSPRALPRHGAPRILLCGRRDDECARSEPPSGQTALRALRAPRRAKQRPEL